MKSYEEQRAAIKERMRRNAENREKKGGKFGRGILKLDDYEDVNFAKPSTEKKNCWDILLYEVLTDKHPGGVNKGDLDYVLDIHVHTGIGALNNSFVCPLKNYGRSCPICEERDARMKSGLAYDSSEVLACTAKRKAYYNIIDLDDPQKGIQIWGTSYALFEKEMLEMAEKQEKETGFITFADLKDGRTVEFWASEATFNKRSYFKFKSFSFARRDEPYDDSVIKETYPLDSMLDVASYDEIRDVFYHLDVTEEASETPDPGHPDIHPIKDPPTTKAETAPTGTGKAAVGRNKGKPQEAGIVPPATEPSKGSLPEAGKPNEQGCQSGHQFGIDTDKKPECLECVDWTDCANKARELKRGGKK